MKLLGIRLTGNAAYPRFSRQVRRPPFSRGTSMSAPLDGLRVVDFTRVLAGPHCTKALRDLGAQVIKIKPPSGDIVRIGLPHAGAMGMYFAHQNPATRTPTLYLNSPPPPDLPPD